MTRREPHHPAGTAGGRRRFRDLSIRAKLVFIATTAAAAALLVACAGFFAYDAVSFRRYLGEEMTAVARILSANTASAVVFNDRQTAASILSGLAEQPHVLFARIVTRGGEEFASYRRADLPPEFAPPAFAAEGHEYLEDRLLVSRPLVFRDESVATLQLVAETAELDARLRRFALLLLAGLAGGALVALLLAARLQRLVSGPMVDLLRVEREVSRRQDYSLRATKHGDDELGGIVDGLNEMLAQIEARDRELTVAKDRAEQANRTKSAFLANMSHELRTPLSAIIGYAEILRDEAQEEGNRPQAEDLSKILGSARNLLVLINEVLDLSKIEAGRTTFYVESFQVRDLVEDVRATIRPLVEKNANALHVDCPAEIGAMKSDQTKLRQVLFNLLANAAKFTRDGTISLQVAREHEAGRDWVSFRVRDSGIGITREQMARLFQPFTQADSSTTRQYGGTGLGLAISKRFCEMMGGDILAESEPGRGSTFTVRLPAQVSSRLRGPEAESATAPIPQGAATGARAAAAVKPGAPVVLVIDDDPSLRDMMTGLLEREGFGVLATATGEEGLRLARETRPALITLDVMMPSLDGWSVLGRLKADPDLADIPVVMVTIVDDKQRGLALGAADYLIKPFDRAHAVSMLRRHLAPGRKGPVLVVDDHADIRSMLRQTLEREGHAVVEAENGRVALEKVRERAPAIVLLDLLMPEMDGFTFLSELRRTEAGRAVPVVLLTVADLSPEERERLKGSVDRIIRKGEYSLEALEREVRSLVRGLARPAAKG